MTVVMTGRSSRSYVLLACRDDTARAQLDATPHATTTLDTAPSLSLSLSHFLGSHQPVLDKCGDGQMLGQ